MRLSRRLARRPRFRNGAIAARYVGQDRFAVHKAEPGYLAVVERQPLAVGALAATAQQEGRGFRPNHALDLAL